MVAKLLSIVVDQVVDVSALPLQIPEIDTVGICTEKVLPIGPKGQGVEMVLFASLEGCHELSLLGDALYFPLGDAEPVSFGDSSLD